jgi:hypothetical protein
MNELGMLDEHTAEVSRGYIRHWLSDEHPPDTAIQQVFTAVDRILKAGRETNEVAYFSSGKSIGCRSRSERSCSRRCTSWMLSGGVSRSSGIIPPSAAIAWRTT